MIWKTNDNSLNKIAAAIIDQNLTIICLFLSVCIYGTILTQFSQKKLREAAFLVNHYNPTHKIYKKY